MIEVIVILSEEFGYIYQSLGFCLDFPVQSLDIKKEFIEIFLCQSCLNILKEYFAINRSCASSTKLRSSRP